MYEKAHQRRETSRIEGIYKKRYYLTMELYSYLKDRVAFVES